MDADEETNNRGTKRKHTNDTEMTNNLQKQPMSPLTDEEIERLTLEKVLSVDPEWDAILQKQEQTASKSEDEISRAIHCVENVIGNVLQKLESIVSTADGETNCRGLEGENYSVDTVLHENLQQNPLIRVTEKDISLLGARAMICVYRKILTQLLIKHRHLSSEAESEIKQLAQKKVCSVETILTEIVDVQKRMISKTGEEMSQVIVTTVQYIYHTFDDFLKTHKLMTSTAAEEIGQLTPTIVSAICSLYDDILQNQRRMASSTEEEIGRTRYDIESVSEKVLLNLKLIVSTTGKHEVAGSEIKRRRHQLEGSVSGTNRTADEQNKASSITRLYDLPLEILDMILQKSCLHWVLNETIKQRNEEVIRSLVSVDFCFYQRTTRTRFKKAIWRHMNNFYKKNKKHIPIARNNKDYLLRNIQLDGNFIFALLSHDCITDEQSRSVQGQHYTRGKIEKLLHLMKFHVCDETKFSNFVKCLRQQGQVTIARILENGGVVIEVKVVCRDEGFINQEQLHQKIKDLQSHVNPKSLETDKHLSFLNNKGLAILNSQSVYRRTLVVWIWCQSVASFEDAKKLYKSNELAELLSEVVYWLAYIQPSAEIMKSTLIATDRNQFNKKAVVSPTSVNFRKEINVGENESVQGVTKLQNKINILCHAAHKSSATHVIRVFEDHDPFNIHCEINIEEIKCPCDIASSQKENCLYVSESKEKCIYKITNEAGIQHKIIKWLTIDYEPSTLSVSSDGNLLLVNASSTSLMIYGSYAEFIKSIQLPRDFMELCHAVESFTGNFIVLHRWIEVESDRYAIMGNKKWIVSEVTDGGEVICRFLHYNMAQRLNCPQYLALDSDGGVFVADTANNRVISLDSNLRWNRMFCPITEQENKFNPRLPYRLCFDEKNNQLIVGVNAISSKEGFDVYTLGRN